MNTNGILGFEVTKELRKLIQFLKDRERTNEILEEVSSSV